MSIRVQNILIALAIIAAVVGGIPHTGGNTALAAVDGYVVYSSPGIAIPDDSPIGATDTLTATTFSATAITDVNVYLDIAIHGLVTCK